MLHQSISTYKDNNCLSFVEEQPITFNEFGNEVNKISSYLIEKGLKQYDKVAILSSNKPNWGIAYFSILEIGAITVPIMPDFSELEIHNIIEHSETKAIFVSNNLLSKINEMVVSNKILIINIDDFSNIINKTNIDYQPIIKASDIASIVYTSGTTGKSKGVVLSHKNLTSQIIMVSHLQPVNSSDVYLSILPLAHTYECSLGLLTGIMSGASTYYLDKLPTPTILISAMKKTKPTMILSVPLIIEKIFKNSVYPKLTSTSYLKILYAIPLFRKILHKKAGEKLLETFGGNLKFFGIGGAKLNKQVESFLLESKKFPYAIGYGITEASPLLAGANPKMVKLESTGKAIKGVDLKINNPNKITGIGEIWAKGDNITSGYYKDEQLTNISFEDGWFKTGDLGYFDKQNRLFIKSRLKNVIIGANGENIYPEDIETVINSFKCVVESLVLEKKGKLVAMVKFNIEDMEKQFSNFKTEMENKIEELKNDLLIHVNSRVNNVSKISIVVSVANEFEKTSTQKIKRYKYF